jgi:hypothetical protein
MYSTFFKVEKEGLKMEYKEILKLKEMLEKANIPFKFTDDFFNTKSIHIELRQQIQDSIKDQYPAYSIQIIKNGKVLCDAVEHTLSYGNKEDLLEIMGGLTEEEQENDSVLGYLTAKEVFKRFKYCYEHSTSVYVKKEE